LVRWFLLVVPVGGCTANRPSTLSSVKPLPELLIRRVADRVILDNPDPPRFNWGEGVLMAGMIKAGLALKEPRYIDFVRTWADNWYGDPLHQRLFGGKGIAKGYCGVWGPGFSIALLYEHTGNPKYREMVQHIADFIATKATRTKEGGLGHFANNYQLWADTLYMVCPTLVHLGRVTTQPKYITEAARELSISTRHLQDPQTGLCYHMWNEPKNRPVGEFWGRGNGWIMMSFAEVLPFLNRTNPHYAPLLERFRRQVRGLLAVQDPQSGMWHTVVNRPESYLETSGTAMILYGLVQGRKYNLVEVEQGAIYKAWKSLSSQVDATDHVINVSRGTGPTTYDKYCTRPRGTYTWGTGGFLLAAQSLYRK
ncbi:MAG: glycoside hydrolase family 88 protein, partial [Planctomycetota bacterium]